MEIGLGFFGSADLLSRYLDAVKPVERLPIVGWWGSEGGAELVPFSIRRYAHPDELLAQPNILGVINCAPLSARAFWCEQVLEAGKSVLCATPLGERYEAVDRLVRRTGEERGRLIAASPAYYGRVGKAMKVRDGLGNLLYFDMEIRLSRKWLTAQRYGVLLLGGVDYLGLIGREWGPVDAVWAQSRSLLRNRPAEDIVQIFFTCMDGKEGRLTVNGLGDKAEERLLLFGRLGSRETCGPGEGDAQVWREAYRDFMCGFEGKEQMGFNGEMARKGFGLMHWVQQAARHNREIKKREVTDGK